MQKNVWFLLFILFFAASCAGTSAGGEAPALLIPVSVKADTARVTRGNVERVSQYRGSVRVKSDKLSYGNTNLRFGECFCLPGDYVEEGQLLIKLETKYLEEQIEKQEEYIERLVIGHTLENELAEIDLSIAQIELADLFSASVSFDESIMYAVENKKMEIERRQLNINQTLARQALTLKNATEDLQKFIRQTEAAEIRAPYSGVITWVRPMSEGDWVKPYLGLIYLSDHTQLFVEYTQVLTLSTSVNTRVIGHIADREYVLERIQLTPQEAAQFYTERKVPPTRFAINDPDEQVKPGAYVSFYVYTNIVYDVLRVPTNTIYTDAGSAYVYVMVNGQKEIRTIETGLRSDVFVEVKSGLSEGDILFVKP
jgi:multidrug efflux pump subunit AcrA (membrane-fusion protein)